MTGPWRKSSRSGGGTDHQCVETRACAGLFQVRDSKLGDCSPTLNMTGDDWQGFLAAVRR